jgi:hypothetical protein
MGILQEEAAGQHARAHHGDPQACMCSPRRPTSCASEAHPRTMGIGAMLGAMRLAVWRLPQTTEAVCSTTVGLRSVPAATFPPRAARADEQCTVRIIRAPYINSRRARYDGMSRLDEDVPTGLAPCWQPVRPPDSGNCGTGPRVTNYFTIASGCRLSCLSPCTCRRNRYSPHVRRARRPGRGRPAGVGSRAPSATARDV